MRFFHKRYIAYWIAAVEWYKSHDAEGQIAIQEWIKANKPKDFKLPAKLSWIDWAYHEMPHCVGDLHDES